MQSITDLLRSMQFSDGEVKVYLTLLKTGEITITFLSRESGVTQSKIYPIIEKLSNKGLVSVTIKDGVKTFNALNPKYLTYYLDKKAEQINEQKKVVEELIPKYLQKDRSKKDAVYVYEGFEGVKNLYEEAIDELKASKKDFIGFTLADEALHEKAKEFFKTYDRKRAKAGIKVRLIAEERQRNYLKDSANIKIRFIKRPVPLGTIIFGNVVATLIWQDTPKAFAIHSDDYAKKYVEFFEDLWKEAKK